eukprot:scaffold7393_cov497-Prasinococcus_capsulatus_cf.AAC.2
MCAARPPDGARGKDAWVSCHALLHASKAPENRRRSSSGPEQGLFGRQELSLGGAWPAPLAATRNG